MKTFMMALTKVIGTLIGAGVLAAIGLAVLAGIVTMWGTLDASYLDIPAASLTARDSWGWYLALGWRAAASLIAWPLLWFVWDLLKALFNAEERPACQTAP
ncbi:MAG: hypothetical protein ACLPWF_04640 [Bryobacteraceae bacterium]